MPLSEYEDRVLAQIESALGAEDPKLASRLRTGKAPLPATGTHIRGGAILLAGLAALIGGLAFKPTTIGGFPVLSVFGYLLMWVGAVQVLTDSVILGLIQLAARVARWAREDRGRPRPG
jgi:hypothetical protein